MIVAQRRAAMPLNVSDDFLENRRSSSLIKHSKTSKKMLMWCTQLCSKPLNNLLPVVFDAIKSLSRRLGFLVRFRVVVNDCVLCVVLYFVFVLSQWRG